MQPIVPAADPPHSTSTAASAVARMQVGLLRIAGRSSLARAH
jgi:hypothetical protein